MAQLNNRPAPKPRFNFMWFWAVVAVGIIAYAIFGNSGSSPVRGDWQMVEELVEGGSVKRIEVLDHERMSVYLHKEDVDSLVKDERFKDMPRIAGGDFNSQYHFDILQELLNNCGLTHADMAVNGKITWDSVDHIGIAGAEIKDYVDWRFNNASDHPPIHVDFTITTTN
jgi:hypothetical protein